ncbi:MAG: hypothetical protein IKJ31_03180, partial [Bacteroidaceae bacterium]|nr:hypothetical protein [Bacteroidaceae bacterium]
MRLKKCIFALVAMLWCLTFSAYSQSAKIGSVTYATLDAAISAANGMTGDVTVEVYGKLDYADATAALGGAYNKISFVGKSSDAEISITRNGQNGYINGSGSTPNVSFSNLILSKPAGTFAGDAGFMNVAFTVYRVATVSYTDCTFPNGACAAGCPTTYTGCTFQKSHEKYSFWAYGTDVTIDSCVFDDDRGIKMYAEGGAKTTEVTVKNSDFSELTGKPAIVLTYGESITLEGNTYSSTGVLELEDNGSSNGTTITSDETVTCVSDAYPNGCGVIVDGQIYRTVSDAATVAESGDAVKVLYTTTETAEFAEGVGLTLADGVTAENVTVKSSAVEAPKGNNFSGYIGTDRLWGETWGNSKESFVIKVVDANDNVMGSASLNNVNGIINGNVNVTWNLLIDAESNTDNFWDMEWTTAPTIDNMPAKVELWVDGTKVSGGDVVLNGPDGLYPVFAANTDANGKILSFISTDGFNLNNATDSLQTAINNAQSGATITLLKDMPLNKTLAIEKSITINGNGHKMTPADANQTYNAAIMAGNSGWGDDHGETIKLENLDLTGWTTNYGVVRAQGVTLVMDNCVLAQNSVSNAAYGVLSLNFTDATVTNSEFNENTSRAIDINYNGDNSNSVVTIDGCTFDSNTSTGAGIVVRNDGEQLVLKNSKFIDNTVNTTGNAATVYAGWGVSDEVTGCYFEGNSVTTSHATTKRFASAIFCDGCKVNDNVFAAGNTAVRNGEAIATTVAVGAYYGAASVSNNYWNGGKPSYTVEFTNNEVANEGYYTEVETDANGNVVIKEDSFVEAGLTGEGTEASPYLINNKKELFYFAKKVNEGETYSGKYVQLVNDIDLEQDDWTPIGNSTYPFMGTFDGNEKNISNLWVTVSGNAGLFGQVAKQTEYVSGTVKDLTVNNATIIASGQNNAGLIAVAPLGARINNVHLTGEVTIQGYRGVGGIVGNGFPQMDGCSVVAEGTITATYWGAGGILGFASDAGAKVTNSTVTSIGQGLTIRGELGGVGAVSGTPHGAKVNGAEITGVVIASNNNYYMGYVDAGGNVENVTVEDVAVKVNGEEIVGCDAVASIGTKGYFSLSSAFAAATDGQTITLLSNVKLAESLIIAADKDVVLDLNGKTISMEDASSATVAMIKNNGKLTINDSSANKDGKLSFKTTTPSMTNAYASNVISNYGEIINAGTIENVSPSGSACYALDNYAGSTATINGGKLTAVKTTVRIFNWTNGDASKATLNVVGGEIISEDGYAININSGNTPSVALNVSGGTITTNDTDYNLAVYIVNQNSAEKFTVNVSGGTFNGNFALNGKTSTTMSEDAIVISGGAFDGVICYETPAQGFVKGGTFKSDVTAYCTDGFTCKENADGTYGVVAAPVAKIGSVEYVSLQDAINAVQAGDTITLLSDVTLSETVELPAGIIFNGNDKTITGTIKAGGNLTFTGNTTVSTFSPGWYNNTITIGEGASLKATEGRMTVSYGNTFNIVGSIENAKTADKTAITPSLELVAGISFNGDGAGVQFNVKNAYVKLGDSSTKHNGATGEFNMNFDNSIVDFTKTLKTYMPTVSGLAPVFNVNATNNSVVSFASHLELWLDNTALTLDNSNLTVSGSFANAGEVTVKGGANFVVNAPIMSSHGGNTGTISVENGTFELKDSNEDWENAGVMKVAVGGKFITNDFKCVGDGKMVVDAANLQGETVVIDGNGVYNFEGVTTVENGDMANVSYENGDVTLSLGTLPGEGTAENPHTISDINELRLFAMSVKAGNNYAGKHVKLGASVDLSAQAVMLMSTEVTPNWEAIGTKEAPFKGTFDGNNETISNMIVVGEKNQGFFGFADNATIKNLKLNNVTVIGTDCVGAVAGQVYSVSLVDNCHVSGTIQVEGQTNVGGIVGKYYTKVANCSVIGDGVATSYVKGVYVASDLEGDNIGGIMGHCGENNSLTGNTVKNITISGTRKVAGIVGIADQNTDIDNCVVQNVVIETTATVDYANSKLSSMSIGALIGQYQAAKATNDGTVINSTVKNVTFNNVNDVTVDVGPIVGGARGGSGAMLAPSADIIATGNNIQLATITGRNNLYLVSPVAKIGDANYYIFEEALDAAQVGDTIVLLADVECAEKPVYEGSGVVNVDVNGHILVSSVKERIRNVVSADGLVPSNNIKFVSGFGWEVY